MGQDGRANAPTYLGLFIVTAATAMYEILLTRIFSVTMWYHFAFMAISVAMFGMTVGALLVYLCAGRFAREKVARDMAVASLLFSITVIASFVAHLAIPLDPGGAALAPLAAATYVLLAIPFTFSGIAVCLALTRFPGSLGRLYAADLAGAAGGCVLLIPTLDLTDGPTAVIVVAALAGLASLLFAVETRGRRLVGLAAVTSLLLGAAVLAHTALVRRQDPWLRLVWVKGKLASPPLYEKWNSFSRITVRGDPDAPRPPTGWGFSALLRPETRDRELVLDIDASASTAIVSYDGRSSRLGFLKYDITNFAHYLRPDARVLVIGTGGGRDVLSALAFDQRSVVGIEINGEIIDAVNGRFGDYSGHLDRDPRVRFVHDEARSYLTRSKDSFDIIQLSLIDTWAATAAGAFVLTENSLYTVEGWKVFLARLDASGILTVSRWYYRKLPGEVYRMTALASASLLERGVRDPRRNIVVLRRMRGGRQGPEGVGTLLVSPAPFSIEDVNRVEQVARQLGFEIVLSPRKAIDRNLEALASGADLASFVARFPIDISPPTDDNPFFFNMLRLRDVFTQRWADQGKMSRNMTAVATLATLLVTILVLTLLCIVVPLLLTGDRRALGGSAPLFAFFACIGFGFMLVEVSQMQRLAVFLGNPTYGLSVVLFTLLLASGFGSYCRSTARGTGRGALMLLLAVLVLFGLATPRLIGLFAGSSTPVRILVAGSTLFPLGILMGMPFPLGMHAAAGRAASLTPWLWGINGATSVCGSVLAVVIALAAGISAAFWTGTAFYLLGAVAFAAVARGATAALQPADRPPS